MEVTRLLLGSFSKGLQSQCNLMRTQSQPTEELVPSGLNPTSQGRSLNKTVVIALTFYLPSASFFLRNSSITDCSNSFACVSSIEIIRKSIAGTIGFLLLVQYTPCCPTSTNAFVSRSSETASRPRSNPNICS